MENDVLRRVLVRTFLSTLSRSSHFPLIILSSICHQRESRLGGDKDISTWNTGTGGKLWLQFQDECAVDRSRFLKQVTMIEMLSFVPDYVKNSKTAVRGVDGAGDVLWRILAVVVKRSSALDTLHILSYPVTEALLSFAHCDGTPLKTEKSHRTRERRQEVVLVDASPR